MTGLCCRYEQMGIGMLQVVEKAWYLHFFRIKDIIKITLLVCRTSVPTRQVVMIWDPVLITRLNSGRYVGVPSAVHFIGTLYFKISRSHCVFCKILSRKRSATFLPLWSGAINLLEIDTNKQ